MADKAFEIVVDDGRKKVPVKNENGDTIGVFYFNPTDVGFVQRFNEVADKFDSIVAPLEEHGADAADEEAIKALAEAEKRLYEVTDYMFGGNVSEAFFGSVNPFSPVNGRFYCEIALEKVGQFISDQFDAETKKINARVDKYVKKYQK